MEFIIVRGRGRIGSRVEGHNTGGILTKHCVLLSLRAYVEDGDLVLEGTHLCPAEYEGELRKAGLEVIGRVTEEEAGKLPRFYALEGFELSP